MQSRWSVTTLLVLTVASSLAASSLAVASAVCSRLEAQLASVSTAPGSSSNYRRYAKAVAMQEGQLRKVRSDLKRFGCTSGSFVVLGGKNADSCEKLSNALNKMQGNLAALERKRDSFAARGSSTAKRRIEAALRANVCDGRSTVTRSATGGPTTQPVRPESPGLVAVLGDSGGKTQPLAPRIVVEPAGTGSGNIRTLCVRTCDGYFFPISSAATPTDFARDERACKMMCPGTGAELYFHSVPDQESAEMLSVRDRQPYTALPTAFAYRNVSVPMSKACSCNMSAFYKEMARREALLQGTVTEEPSVTTWVKPTRRPDPGEDPETIANLDANLSQEDMAAVAASSRNARSIGPQDRHVRVVGPAFLPEESEALDLRANTDRIFR